VREIYEELAQETPEKEPSGCHECRIRLLPGPGHQTRPFFCPISPKPCLRSHARCSTTTRDSIRAAFYPKQALSFSFRRLSSPRRGEVGRGGRAGSGKRDSPSLALPLRGRGFEASDLSLQLAQNEPRSARECAIPTSLRQGFGCQAPPLPLQGRESGR
jgi:hypothetical protein